MDTGVVLVGAPCPAVTDRGQGLRGALDGGALHVVLDAADAAHLLAAAGATRPAVHQVGQGRAVSRRFCGAVPVDDHHAAVIRGGAEHEFASDVVVVGDNRSGEAAFAHARQLDGLAEVVVGKNRADGTEGLDRVDGARGQWFLAVQQCWHEEGAFFRVGVDDLEVVTAAVDDLGLLGEFADAVAHFVALALAGQGAHVDFLVGRITDADLAERVGQCLGDLAGDRSRGDDAADRRALLAGLAGHLVDDFLDVEIELRRARHCVRAQDRGIE